jgi:hypothetical protein
MSPGQPSYAVGLACGLSVPFIWGLWIVASRFGVTHSLTPYDVTALRIGVAGVIVLPVVLTRGLSGLALGRAVVISCGVGAYSPTPPCRSSPLFSPSCGCTSAPPANGWWRWR